MKVTEVRIKLMGAGPIAATRDRVRAYCSILLDGVFAVRDIKVVEGADGLFVAMPSRKIADHCPTCGSKNHLRARFCNGCGSRLDEGRATGGAGDVSSGRVRLHCDVAHPINAEHREAIQDAILAAYAKEVEASRLPGYACRYDDYGAPERQKLPAVATPPSASKSPAPPTISDRLPVRGRAS